MYTRRNQQTSKAHLGKQEYDPKDRVPPRGEPLRSNLHAEAAGQPAQHGAQHQPHERVSQKWVWVKMTPSGDSRFESTFPFTRVPSWVPIFDPHPNITMRSLGFGTVLVTVLAKNVCFCFPLSRGSTVDGSEIHFAPD